jgi:hypothetical protein
MTTDRATAAAWVREVAADRWDPLLATQGFGRSATGLEYVRKVADDGRQRLHLDLERRAEGIHLSLRATVAFPSVAKLALRLLGSAAGGFGKANVVDMGLLDTLDPKAPMWTFESREGLAALAPEVDGYLLDPMMSYLDARATVAAFAEAKRAAWLAAARPGGTGNHAVVVAAADLALGEPGKALSILHQAYPPGTPGREEYAEAFAVVSELAAETSGQPGAPVQPEASPTLRFELTTANSLVAIPVPNPGPEQIERVVRNLNEDRFYTLLQRSDGVYAQVGVGPKAAAGPGEYALEHRDGPAGEQLRAATTDQDEAVRFLQRFRAGEDWRGAHTWRRLDL